MDAIADLPVMSGSKVNAKKLGWFLKMKWSAPLEVIHPYCWSADRIEGWRDGKEAA
jgi:hypothetical protein